MSQRGEVIEQILKLANKPKWVKATEFVADVIEGMINPDLRRPSKYNPRFYVKTVYSQLLERGWLKLEQKGNRKYTRLTPAGREELSKYLLDDIEIRKPRKWDKKWRVLIFDIKEFKKKTRERLRYRLMSLGLARLQDSVYVYPYDCEELLTLLKAYFKLGSEVIYMTVDKIENDRWLREDFELI